MIESSTRRPDGTWSKPSVISSKIGISGEAKVSVDPAGEAIAVWRNGRREHSVIETADRPAGGSWSAPVAVSGSGENDEPQVTVDPAGEAVVVWRTERKASPSPGRELVPASWRGLVGAGARVCPA
jgi:hypothetical protein